MDLQCLRNFSNFLITTEVEMAIWEPCNYVSNLAYDRLLVEMCVQQVWLICFRIIFWEYVKTWNSETSFLFSVFINLNTLLWSWDGGNNQNIMLEIPSHSGLDPSCKNGDEDCWKFRNSHFWVLLHAWQVLLLHLKIIWDKRYVCSCFNINRCMRSITQFFLQIITNHFHFWK